MKIAVMQINGERVDVDVMPEMTIGDLAALALLYIYIELYIYSYIYIIYILYYRSFQMLLTLDGKKTPL